MEDKNVIQLLRHYRHDLMNHLQILQGYLSMGKTDKVQKKLTTYMQQLQEEGKLVNLHTPAFALYLLQFDSFYTNFRLTYQIQTEKTNLQSADQLLVSRCKHIMEKFTNASDEMELYEVNIKLYDKSPAVIALEFTINGTFSDSSVFQQSMVNEENEITVNYEPNKVTCTASVRCK